MPNSQQLRKNMKLVTAAKKQVMLSEVAKSSSFVAGIVSINEVKTKKNEIPPPAGERQVKDYVDHFSHIADILGTEQVGVRKIFA